MSFNLNTRSISFGSSLLQLLSAGDTRRQLELWATIGLTLVAAAAELMTLGAVLPVLAIATEAPSVTNLSFVDIYLARLASLLSVGPVVAAAVVLTSAAIFATVARIALMWVSQRFVFGIQRDLLLRIFGRALRQPYSWYLQQNSSVLIASQTKIAIVIGNLVTPLIQALSALAMAVSLSVFLFILNPSAALIAGLSIGLAYVGMGYYARRRAKTVTSGLASVHAARIQILQEALGGIRDINLDRSQSVFETRLLGIEDHYRQLAGIANFLQFAPRLIIEGLAIILIAIIAVWYSVQPGGALAAIPVLGALALGAQRMLPMVQMIYQGFSGSTLYAANLADVIELLNTPIESQPEPRSKLPQRFEKSIALSNVNFNYETEIAVLSNVTLEIKKGQQVAFIGPTGSGKSTLVDILMGLLAPTTGQLLIDDVVVNPAEIDSWKAQIAHVPQNIFLTDDTIAANIAFGISCDDWDVGRILTSAQKAGLADLISELDSGLETRVGERGVRLSGGQRQRIGIARALYKCASVLVLDEATSALDETTEAAVMHSIEQLRGELTVITIAHRLSTISACDRVYRLEEGRIVQEGSFVEVVNAPRQASSRSVESK